MMEAAGMHADPERPTKTPARGWLIWMPLVLFALVAAIALLVEMKPADTTVRSTMIDQPLPDFDLAPALGTLPGVSRRSLSDGKVHVVNFFASWCLPCRIEAPQLDALRRADVDIVGIAVRDDRGALKAFLGRSGNPYAAIGRDDSGQVQLEFGASGVPESFIVDGHGIIRYQHVGVIAASDIPALLERIRKASQ